MIVSGQDEVRRWWRLMMMVVVLVAWVVAVDMVVDGSSGGIRGLECGRCLWW